MTQAAVSYQIKILEDRVGAPLFIRLPRQVTLTAKGRQLAPAVTEAFEALRTAFAGVEEAVQTVLSITTLTTFASNWLVPRLGRFQQLHPEHCGSDQCLGRDGRIRARASSTSESGAATGDWPGLEAHLLFPNQFTPVCSPELLRDVDVQRAHPTSSNSRSSRRAIRGGRIGSLRQGCRTSILRRRPTTRLGAQQFEGMAAMAGQGFALINPYLLPGRSGVQGASSSPSTCWPLTIGATGWSIRKRAGAPPRSKRSGIGC